VVARARVWCWCGSDSVKARNVERSGRAALVAYKGERFALVRGPARLVRAGEPEYDEITQAFLAKYGREETYGNDVLVEITPARVSAGE